MKDTLKYSKPYSFNGSFSKLIIENFIPEVFMDDNGLTIKEIIPKNNNHYPISETIFYNRNNKVIERKEVSSTGYVWIKKYSYDNRGNLIEYVIPSSEQKTPFKRYIFDYNNLNLLIKKTKYEYTYKHYTNYYKYDINNLLTIVSWRSERYAEIDFLHQYDSYGNLIKKTGEYIRGAVAEFLEILYEYDEKNRLIKEQKEEYSDIRGVIISERTIEYVDNNSSLIKKELLKEVKPLEKIISFEYSYDSFGNVVLLNEYIDNTFKRKSKWQYKYDDLGNWIYAIRYDNDKPKLISKRTFIE